AVDDPGLNLQLVRGEPLDADAVEEPWCVGGNIRWLISPVIEVVVAEQSDVGHENPGIDVQSVIYVKVVSAVGFRYVFVCTTKVPLAAAHAGVIARRCNTEHSIHGENAAADILPVEVAAKADLLQLDFVGAKDLGRATHAIVPWIVETVNV